MSASRKRLTGPIHGRIRRRLKELDISLTDFGKRVGVRVDVVCHWTKARARPDIERLPKIAEVLGVTELSLVRGEKAWAAYERVLRRAA